MLRRFSNRREAVAQSMAATLLSMRKPIPTTTAAWAVTLPAWPFSPTPGGKSRKTIEPCAAESTARRAAQPRAGGELLQGAL